MGFKKYDEGLRIAAKNWNMQRENDDFEVMPPLHLIVKIVKAQKNY
jgi:hypothetical protein